MATYTSNYAWTKPSGNDNVDISVLNANLDSQDSIMHDAFMNMAQAFSETSTYAVDDIVVYGTTTYKCHTAVTTAGSWTGATNWQVYKLSEGGGGGGTSDYPDLTNKPQINGVTLSGNKTTGDLGLQDKMQYSTMPTASADNVGKIYQYVGTADANYTNGYYYKCVENSGSYSWQLVENIKEQTPTFSQASTRNNIASGEKLSVIMGKIQKFFNDLKTVAFSGNASDLNYDNTTSGLSATKVQGAVDELAEEKADKSDIAPEFNTTTAYAKGDLCYHEGTLYEFNQAHAAGAWNSAHADVSKLNDVLSTMMPRTARGTTLVQLVNAVNQLNTEQKNRCLIYINDNRTLIFTANSYFACMIATGSSNYALSQYRFDPTGGGSYKRYIAGASTAEDQTISKWVLYYQGTPIT